MALTQVQPGMLASDSQYTGFKNRLINSAMVIDQRNAGASVATTTTGSAVYTLDRWAYNVSQASKFTVQQNAGSVTPPVGFTNYLGCTSTSAYTVGAGESFNIQQRIEGFNIADLGWGTASAKTVTLSAWVYSSLTGTFGGSIFNNAANRSYPFAYSIPVANTWTQISVTIAGDTSGTWVTNNGIGMYLAFSLGTGSSASATAGSWTSGFYFSSTGATSVVGTNGATFYITGVQLEKGSTATSFDYRPYGTELQLCMRYYTRYSNTGATANNQAFLSGVVRNATSAAQCGSAFPVPMRAAPTGSYGGGIRMYDGSNVSAITSIASQESSTTVASLALNASGGGFTAGRVGQIVPDGSSACYFDFSAEL